MSIKNIFLGSVSKRRNTHESVHESRGLTFILEGFRLRMTRIWKYIASSAAKLNQHGLYLSDESKELKLGQLYIELVK